MVLLRPSTGPAARKRYSSATIARNPAEAQRLVALHPTVLSAAGAVSGATWSARAEQAAGRTGSTLLARGVYRAPSLSATGQLVYFAVDHYHCEVARVELDPERLPDDAVVAELWRRLDAADPEHARRKTRSLDRAGRS
jgi:hypothetical protein